MIVNSQQFKDFAAKMNNQLVPPSSSNNNKLPAPLPATGAHVSAISKPTKLRRTRQARNPQQSVARRNERERNRVKMVNNGFALLRQHLPVEDLQHQASVYGDNQSALDSGSETNGPATPAGGPLDNKCPTGSTGIGGGKAKKFSKVETLRAAIQRIRMLEELIRSTEPEFESVNIGGQVTPAAPVQPKEDHFDEPDDAMMSASHPQMIASPASANYTAYQHHYNQQQQQQQQFVKLCMEPSRHQQQHHFTASTIVGSVPSPPNSQISLSSCNSNSSTGSTSAAHHTHNPNQHQTLTVAYQPHEQAAVQQHQHQHQHMPVKHQQPFAPSTTAATTTTTTTDHLSINTTSHTHLWLEQHHNSFMHASEPQYVDQQLQWYPQMPTPMAEADMQQQQQPIEQRCNWQQQLQQHQQSESPVDQLNQRLQQTSSPIVWYRNSTLSPQEVSGQSSSTGMDNSEASEQPLQVKCEPMQANDTVAQHHSFIHQHHNHNQQISLYSQ